jgi:hypothetical protein
MAGHVPDMKLNRGNEMMIQKKTLLSIAVGLVLAGCGGGGGYNPPVAQPLFVTSGKSIDGYLSGASVLCDTNDNGIADVGEKISITNAAGDFAFSPGCPSTLVSRGGTNTDTGLPFKGMIKAPIGSLFITPLTTLMADTGLSAADVATALGLPDGTDVTRLDPMLSVNFDLQKKTLAIQQIIQQTTDTLAALAQNTSPAALEAIYSTVAKSVAATLAVTTAPLIDASGVINSSLVSNVIIDSTNKVAASTDASLASSKEILADYSGERIAQLVSSAIVIQAQTLANASATDIGALTSDAEALQANPTISNAAAKFKTLLTTASNSTVNLTTAGTALETIADNKSSSSAINTAISTIGATTSIAVTANDLIQQSNVVSITGIALNGASSPIPLSAFATGVNLAQSFNSLGFSYAIKGSPIPVSGNTRTAAVRIGIELTDTSNKGQLLQVILDDVNVVLTGDQLSITLGTNPNMHFYAITSGKTVFAKTVNYADANNIFSTSAGKLTVNANSMLNKLFGDGQTVTANLHGTFNVRMVISNLSIAGESATSVQGSSVSVNGTSQSVTGLSVQGKFTLP